MKLAHTLSSVHAGRAGWGSGEARESCFGALVRVKKYLKNDTFVDR